MKIKIDGGFDQIPIRAHKTDAGLDLKATGYQVIFPKDSAVFGTGVHVQLPAGTCGLIMSNSGLNVKHGLFCTGLIDEGYTGEILIRLFNFGDRPYVVQKGDKVAQLVVVPCYYEPLELVDKLDESERGNNGFGSTGR